MESGTERPKPISILIAVSVRLYRDGLAATLSEQKHLRVAGTAGTSLDGQLAARALQPDVVVVDVSLTDALSLIRTLRAEQPISRILAFAVEEDICTILEYAEAGADGFVSTNCSAIELTEAIERTAAGELLCSPRIAADLLRSAAQRVREHTRWDVNTLLTGREQQVFTLLKIGRCNKEIARALGISQATVKNHVHQVLKKLQVTTRSQAAATSHRSNFAPQQSAAHPTGPS
jgi:two-component system, NarL family, nitrate/nitrite response regulator NarL